MIPKIRSRRWQLAAAESSLSSNSSRRAMMLHTVVRVASTRRANASRSPTEQRVRQVRA
ncbi:MAG: hypothetical protein KTR25_20050 [Myxococcales bacterium]|nr:hypothetical protein [Myxococcales bacterium]